MWALVPQDFLHCSAQQLSCGRIKGKIDAAGAVDAHYVVFGFGIGHAVQGFAVAGKFRVLQPSVHGAVPAL